jgi:hypothetical protein
MLQQRRIRAKNAEIAGEGEGALTIPSLAAQRRQADAGGVEAAIDGENLPRDIA